MTQDLLLELGTEDLPARYVWDLANTLVGVVAEGLETRGLIAAPRTFKGDLANGNIKGFATPRRVAVLVKSVATEQPEQNVERKGPQVSAAYKDGKPTQAALGFAKSCGVEFDALQQENGYLVFRKKHEGRKAIELIPEIFEAALKRMDAVVPKRMRWGASEETFVRPVQWILALHGDKVVPLHRFGLEAGNRTYGHRFHSPGAIDISAPSEYERKLRSAKVWADFASRRTEIKAQVEAEATRLRGTARISEDLLYEVTALVEWPVAISGTIEERFLQLPPEVVVMTVETNQRYFTVFDSANRLLPHFITVSNIESKDVSQVIAGNERVVRPRLTDALFFWEQDLKTWRRDARQGFLTLGEMLISTEWGLKAKGTTYAKGLGTYDDRLSRVQLIGSSVCQALGVSDEVVQPAAVYAKADLFSRMVYEFPELQGVMGGYYAQAAGIRQEVCAAIREQYLPNSANSPIPTSEGGRILALADKLDSIAGMFAIGQKPTASKDPYGMRRAALGALRICIEGQLDIDLRAALGFAFALQPAGQKNEAEFKDLWQFVVERSRNKYFDQYKTEEKESLLAELGPSPGLMVKSIVADVPALKVFESIEALDISNPFDFDRRFKAVYGFFSTPAAGSLVAADKRARNILKQAGYPSGMVQSDLFEVPAEHALFAELDRVEEALKPVRERSDYVSMLQALAALKEPVDAFFDGVMVMADKLEVRGNRLALLARLDALCREVADLSCLPG